MKKEDRYMLFNKIYSKYCNSIWIHAGAKEDDFYSYIISREIIIPERVFSDPSDWDIFALLHEIGHVVTNNNKQKRYYQEYLATQWAIQEAKRVGFKVPKQYVNVYQNYIWRWRDSSIKRGGKNVQDKEELTLVI